MNHPIEFKVNYSTYVIQILGALIFLGIAAYFTFSIGDFHLGLKIIMTIVMLFLFYYFIIKKLWYLIFEQVQINITLEGIEHYSGKKSQLNLWKDITKISFAEVEEGTHIVPSIHLMTQNMNLIKIPLSNLDQEPKHIFEVILREKELSV